MPPNTHRIARLNLGLMALDDFATTLTLLSSQMMVPLARDQARLSSLSWANVNCLDQNALPYTQRSHDHQTTLRFRSAILPPSPDSRPDGTRPYTRLSASAWVSYGSRYTPRFGWLSLGARQPARLALYSHKFCWSVAPEQWSLAGGYGLSADDERASLSTRLAWHVHELVGCLVKLSHHSFAPFDFR